MAKETRPTPNRPGSPPVPDDWRVFRPAIWTVMLGIAIVLVVNAVLGIAVVGAGLGIGLKIHTRRRRVRRAGRGTVRRR